MSEEAAPAEADAAPATKGRKPLLLILIALVVLAGAGIGGFLFLHHSPKQAKAEPTTPAEYYTLDPAIVVNFQDDRAIRFLQVGVSLMTHDAKAIDAAKAADPRIRNALVLLFSSQKYEVLASEAGKLKLQQEALAKVREVIPTPDGKPGIEAVYFTSFVMQ